VNECVPFIVVSLLLGASDAPTIEIVLLLECELARGHILHTLIDVANGDFFACGDRTRRHDKHAAPAEHSYSVRPTAMIDQVCWPVQSSACTEECLVTDAERVHFKYRVDVYDQFEVLDIEGKLGAA